MTVIHIPKLYTDAEAAKVLRVSPTTVGRLRRSREIASTPIRGKVFVTAEHIREYLERQTVTSKP